MGALHGAVTARQGGVPPQAFRPPPRPGVALGHSLAGCWGKAALWMGDPWGPASVASVSLQDQGSCWKKRVPSICVEGDMCPLPLEVGWSTSTEFPLTAFSTAGGCQSPAL